MSMIALSEPCVRVREQWLTGRTDNADWWFSTYLGNADVSEQKSTMLLGKLSRNMGFKNIVIQ